MASNFAFYPMGLSQRVTVVATAGSITFNITPLGGTADTVVAVPGIRISNSGTVAAFVQFGSAAGTVTVGLNTGVEIMAGSVETFRLNGQRAMAFVSSGTTTLGITPGEGM